MSFDRDSMLTAVLTGECPAEVFVDYIDERGEHVHADEIRRYGLLLYDNKPIIFLGDRTLLASYNSLRPHEEEHGYIQVRYIDPTLEDELKEVQTALAALHPHIIESVHWQTTWRECKRRGFLMGSLCYRRGANTMFLDDMVDPYSFKLRNFRGEVSVVPSASISFLHIPRDLND